MAIGRVWAVSHALSHTLSVTDCGRPHEVIPVYISLTQIVILIVFCLHPSAQVTPDLLGPHSEGGVELVPSWNDSRKVVQQSGYIILEGRRGDKRTGHSQ